MAKGLAGRYFVVGLPGVIPRAISMATHSWANHAGLMLDDETVVEAWVPTVHVRSLHDYDGLRLQFCEDQLSAEQRGQIVAYAKGMLGKPYDLVHFGALALRYLFGRDLLAKVPLPPHTAICSRLVAQAGAAAGLDWTGGNPLSMVTPATLAERLEGRRAHADLPLAS